MNARAKPYAERHGWQNISRAQWRNHKRRGVTLTVLKAQESPDYLLRIEADEEVIASDGFERAAFALQFGDYLWENVLSSQDHIDAVVVRQQHGKWRQNLPILPSGERRYGSGEDWPVPLRDVTRRRFNVEFCFLIGIINLTSGFFASYIAKSKRRNDAAWLLLGWAFGPLAMLAIGLTEPDNKPTTLSTKGDSR